MDEQHFRLRGHPSEPGAGSGADDYVDSRGSGRALAYVKHAVLEGDSLVVLTGEPGTGKSVLVGRLLRDLAPDNVVPALLAAKRVDVAALLSAVVKAFRAPLAGHSVDELRAGLQAFLATLTASGRRALLVVDDAQHLLPAAIKELTELASLRSTRDAPLQIVLAGRPELRSTLQRALLGASVEPVFLFCEVAPLSAAETRAFVEQRFRRARPDEPPSCSADVHQRIHEATRGVPGAIDPLCQRLLAITAERRLARVAPELVEEATSAWRAEVAEGRSAREGGGAQAAGVDGLQGLAATRRVPARAAVRNPRAAVLLVAGVLVASLFAVGFHEYQGLLAEQRLSSLAVATRVAPAVAPALPAAPVASIAPLPPSPEGAALSAVPAAVPARTAPPAAPGAARAEPNGWEAVPAPAMTRPRRAPEQRLQDLRAPPPAPVAGACSATVVALGLCDGGQKP